MNGKYFSIFDGKTEFDLGQTLFQKAELNHMGGFYVYQTYEEAATCHML